MLYKSRLIMAGVFSLLGVLCQLAVSEMIEWFVTAAQADGGDKALRGLWVIKFAVAHGWFDVAHARFGLIWIVTVLVVVIYVPKALFSYFNGYLVASVTNRIGTDVRNEMYGT